MKNIETNGLPTSWSWTTLDNVIIALESGNRPKGGVKGIDKGIPSLGGEHLEYGGGFKFDKIKYVPPAFYEQMSKGKIRINDILVVKDGATTGKAAHISNSFPFRDAAVNEHVFILRIDKELMSSKYLFLWIQSLMGQECIRRNISGSAQGGINSQFVKNSNLPLAPTNEQYRIVAKIEELFTKLDAGVAALKQTQAKLRRYRQSVLKAAVEGRLTAEWREKHKDELEPADKLLKRIQEQLKAKRGMRYKETKSVDITDLPELPEGWLWTSLGQLGNVIGGLTKSAKREKMHTKLPYLRVANVYANKIKLDEIKYIGVLEKELNRVLLQKNDLLIVEGNGSLNQIGRVALWKDEIKPCVHQNHIIKVRLQLNELAKYFLYWLISNEGRKYITRVASSTSGLYTLNLLKVSTIPIPLAPEKEQEIIVREIERQLSIIDESELALKSEFTRAQSLRQSILKRAFEGKLVPQDPNDEPASVLLERIKVEKAKPNKSKKLEMS